MCNRYLLSRKRRLSSFLAMTRKGNAFCLEMTKKNNLHVPLHFTTLINSYIEKLFRKRGVTVFGGLFLFLFWTSKKRKGTNDGIILNAGICATAICFLEKEDCFVPSNDEKEDCFVPRNDEEGDCLLPRND